MEYAHKQNKWVIDEDQFQSGGKGDAEVYKLKNTNLVILQAFNGVMVAVGIQEYTAFRGWAGSTLARPAEGWGFDTRQRTPAILESLILLTREVLREVR